MVTQTRARRSRLNSGPDRLEISREEKNEEKMRKKRLIQSRMSSFGNIKIVDESSEIESDKKYFCGACDKSFYHRSALDAHQLIHSTLDLSMSINSSETSSDSSTPGSPNKCKSCKKKFSSSLRRKIHDMKYHTDAVGTKLEILAVL